MGKRGKVRILRGAWGATVVLLVVWSAAGEMARAQPAAVTPPSSQPSMTPALLVQTIAPAEVNLGQTWTCEIVLRNVGPVPLLKLKVEDELPPNARYRNADPRPAVQNQHLTWELDGIDPGAERRLQVEVEPAGDGDLQSQVVVTFSGATEIRAKTTRPKLAVSVTGPESVAIGDPAPFEIRVSNAGSGAARRILVRDTLPAGLEHPQGKTVEADIDTLAAGETRTIPLRATAVRAGRQVNAVAVTADGCPEATAQAVVQVTVPELQLRNTGPAVRYLGREAEFDLEVHNPGTAPAATVQVTDLVPEGMTFVSASDGGASDDATRKVLWDLGTLAPGQRRGLTVKLKAKTAGQWVNRATAQADRVQPVSAEAAIRLEGVPALMLEVVDLDDPIEVGAETVYEIRVVNQGTIATTGLRIVATVPPGLQALDATGPSTWSITDKQVIFAPVPKLGSHADALYRVHVRGIEAGDQRFKVQMFSDQLQLPVYEEESTHVYRD